MAVPKVMRRVSGLICGAVLLVSCGSEATTKTVAQTGSETSQTMTTTTKAAPGQKGGSPDAFVDLIAASPEVTQTDSSLPPSPAILRSRSAGSITGTVTAAEQAPANKYTLSTPGDDQVAFPMNRLAVRLTVSADNGTGDGAELSGRQVFIDVPVYSGPDEFLDRASAEYVVPAVAAAPVGSEVFVVLGDSGLDDPQVIALSTPNSLFLSGSRGVVNAGVFSDQAPIWGLRSVKDLQTAFGT